MKIHIGADHAGFELKEKLIPFIEGLGFEVDDKGATKYDENDDYPDFIARVAQEVSTNPEMARGIVIGGSGQGEAIAANKFPNVRAALYYGGKKDIVILSRAHNDSNILSLGARFITEGEAKDAVALWLETEFSGDERHVRRIDRITEIENFNE